MQDPSERDPVDVSTPSSMRGAARQDLAGSTWTQRLLLVATVGWVAYEWGFGNETVTPWILVRVVAATSGVWSVVAAATVGFVFTVVQQSVSGLTAVHGFAMFRRTAGAARRTLRSRLDRDPSTWTELGLVTKAIVVFTLGTTAVVLIESTTTGDVDTRRQRVIVAQAAVLVGAIVAAIAVVGATAVLVGRSVSWLEQPTEWLLRVLGNPLTWIGLLAVVLTVDAVRRRRGSGSAERSTRSPS